MQVTPGVPIELGHGLRAQAFDVEHSGRTRTVAYRFTGPDGESLVYAPDLAGPPGSKLAKGADLLMLGAATRERTVKDHMPMTESIAAARKLKPGRTLFTHIGHRIGTHAELEAWVPDGFGVSYDGLELEPGSA
jgi:phosphoribosyl 1,2-cyclic phosphate phosphodiesterase